jgi:hypothetical protein
MTLHIRRRWAVTGLPFTRRTVQQVLVGIPLETVGNQEGDWKTKHSQALLIVIDTAIMTKA